MVEGGGRDALNRRRRLQPVSTGKRIRPQARDLLWFARLREHGPLPTSFLLRYCRDTHANEKRSRERLTDLFNEDDTPDDGPYLIRQPQQFRTLDSRYNQIVYDLAPAALKALERSDVGCASSAAPSGPWLHRFMTSCITASIELATLDRSDLRYIPQSEILARAEADLRYTVRVADPQTGEVKRTDLIPDALFGLEYRGEAGSRFRFFAVEADRATEPATSANFSRKSVERNFGQYQNYIEDGLYREHLGLTSPLLVLTVTNDAKRTEQMLRLAVSLYPDGNSYLLFKSWEDFGPVFRPPRPNAGLLEEAWERAGMEAFGIDGV